MTNLEYLGWLLLSLAMLVLLQRRLHFETQSIFLLITRRPEIALILFSILFFPGVLIHETSHYIFARLLGVRTGRFSLLPRPLPDGRLQLGFVETTSTDLLRDALIGSAPLLVGSVFVVYAGQVLLGLPALWDFLAREGPGTFLEAFSRIQTRSDFWLWFYLTFVVSSTMLPSVSDRRAWLPLAITMAIFTGLAWLAGADTWLAGAWQHIAPQVERALRTLAMVFSISAVLHVILLPPLWALRKSIGKVTNTSLQLT